MIRIGSPALPRTTAVTPPDTRSTKSTAARFLGVRSRPASTAKGMKAENGM